MAAVDDSWDVHYKCVAMGLDPDRLSHLARAREALRVEHEKAYRAPKRTPDGKRRFNFPIKLFMERYK